MIEDIKDKALNSMTSDSLFLDMLLCQLGGVTISLSKDKLEKLEKSYNYPTK